MNSELFFNTAVCNDYERLLKKCETALQIWDERREEICRARLSGKEVGDELLRLQADFARAYRVLRRHTDNCDLCRFVSKVLPVPTRKFFLGCRVACDPCRRGQLPIAHTASSIDRMSAPKRRRVGAATPTVLPPPLASGHPRCVPH